MNNIETGWLIEYNDLYLGICSKGLKWSTPHFALRFTREKDAKLFAKWLVSIDQIPDGFKVNEHKWCI